MRLTSTNIALLVLGVILSCVAIAVFIILAVAEVISDKGDVIISSSRIDFEI